jgi:hypothetical protein
MIAKTALKDRKMSKIFVNDFPNEEIRVPDLVSQNRDVVLVRRIFSSGKPRGVGNLEWKGNGEGMGRGRSVYE